ncbi:RNA polymerase sigma factor RpoD/SigA [bacterium]|nr:RNA polymerase sigma factor RpoD/SigA [bacterium]
MFQGPDGIKQYLREISDHRVLTKDEEHALFERLRSGDESARQEILCCNLRLVVRLAQQFRGKGLAMEDLIQEGNMGLMDVIKRFDHNLGFRFSTYAAFWIRQSMQVALRKQRSMIRIPVRKMRQLGQINNVIQEYQSICGRQPTTAELARRLKIDEAHVEDLMGMSRTAVSIDMPLDEEGSTLQDHLADETLKPASDQTMQSEMERRIEAALAQLSEREHSVLRLRFGLGGQKPRSLRNVSKRVGLSQEGVRRVEQRALAKLGRQQFRCQLAGLL